MCMSPGEFKKYNSKGTVFAFKSKTKSGSKISICEIIGQKLSAKLYTMVRKFENNSEKEGLSVGCNCQKRILGGDAILSEF